MRAKGVASTMLGRRKPAPAYLRAALHIAPDELTGGLVVLSLFPAALFATWAASGRVGVRSLICRAFYWRVSPGWWLTVLFGLPVLTVGLAY